MNLNIFQKFEDFNSYLNLKEKHKKLGESLEKEKERILNNCSQVVSSRERMKEELKDIDEYLTSVIEHFGREPEDSNVESEQESVESNDLERWQKDTANIPRKDNCAFFDKPREGINNGKRFKNRKMTEIKFDVMKYIAEDSERLRVFLKAVREKKINRYTLDNTRPVKFGSFSYYNMSSIDFLSQMRKLKKIFPELSLEIVWQDSNNNLFKTII